MVRLFFNGQSVLRLATAAPHLSRSIDDRLRLLPYNTRRKINKIPHDLPQPNPFFGFGVSLSFYELREDFFLVSLALSFSSHVSTMSRSKIGKWREKFHHHHLSLCAILSIFDHFGEGTKLWRSFNWWKSRALCDEFYPPKRINLLMRFFFFDSSHHFLSIFRNSIISSLHVKKNKFE